MGYSFLKKRIDLIIATPNNMDSLVVQCEEMSHHTAVLIGVAGVFDRGTLELASAKHVLPRRDYAKRRFDSNRWRQQVAPPSLKC